MSEDGMCLYTMEFETPAACSFAGADFFHDAARELTKRISDFGRESAPGI